MRLISPLAARPLAGLPLALVAVLGAACPALAQPASPASRADPSAADPSAADPSAGGPPPGVRPAGPPVPAGWTLSVGVATLFGTAWQGSRQTALAVLPDLRIGYRDSLFASVPEGLGWNAVNRAGWKAGPLVKPRFGRNAEDGGSPFQVAGGSAALRGMGDIGIAGEAGGFVEKRFGPAGQWRLRAELRQGFGGHSGLVGDLTLNRAGRIGRTLYAVGPRATFASQDYMQTYFGVDAGQSARTGLAVSRPAGGLVAVGLGGSLIHPLDRRRAVLLFGGVDRLGDSPAGSALIRARGQRTTFTAGLAYSFRFRL